MEILQSRNHDAENRTGETCADMGGLRCILRPASKKEGFDYDRLFVLLLIYLSWLQDRRREQNFRETDLNTGREQWEE